MTQSRADFNQKKLFTVSKLEMELLKAKARLSEPKSHRICVHSSPDAPLHEMLIVLPKSVYFKPHRHREKSESFHLVEGELDVFLFDERGNVTQKIEMGEYRSGKTFYYRLAAPVFHTVLPRTSQVIFQETTNGPFLKSETEFCTWAPDERDLEGVRVFLDNLSIAL